MSRLSRSLKLSLGRRIPVRTRRSFVPDQVGQSVLEARQVLSTASLSAAGVLTVTGTSGKDTISVLESQTWTNAGDSYFPTNSIKSILVNGLDGDDALSVTLTDATSLPVTLNGGTGTNTYTAPANTTVIDPTLTAGVAMSKVVMDKYQAVGATVRAALGTPTGGEVAAFGGRVVPFQGGEIDYSAATGAHDVYGAAYSKLQATASQTDAYGSSVRTVLGLATRDLSSDIYGTSSNAYFQGGYIVTGSGVASHVVYGSIATEVQGLDSNGYLMSIDLGPATSDEAPGPNGSRVQHFTSGDVYWSPTTGAHAVYGPMLTEFTATAGQTDPGGHSVQSDLGLPTSEEVSAYGGWVEHFQGGDIDYSNPTGARAVYGPILRSLNATAGEYDAYGHSVRTILGLPTSEQTSSNVGWVEHFQGGDMDYSGPTGAHAVYGAIGVAFASYGGTTSPLGFPTADESPGIVGSSYGRVQAFQRGTLNYLAGSPILLGANRSQVIAALTASQANAVLGTPALAFFQTLAQPGSLVDPITHDLLNKLVNGDPADAHYQGVNLGGTVLTSSTTAVKVSDLESKWFLGTDHPTADQAYQATTLPLFGTGGPVYSDVVQGNDGDCYFLASLAATAARSPQAIRNMFTDNGDGTYSVRFFKSGVAEYVTVDRQLPGGGTDMASTTSGSIWVALAEKAFVQMNESNWLSTTTPGQNAYSAIYNGSDWVALNAINGKAATGGPFSSTSTPSIDTTWANGQAMVLYTTGNAYSTTVVSKHVYAVVGYNSTTKLYTVYNPWGLAGGTEPNPTTGKQDFKAGLLTLTTTQIRSLFNGEDSTTASASAPSPSTARLEVLAPAATCSQASPLIVPLVVGDPQAAAAGAAADDDAPAVRVGVAHPRHARGAWGAWS